MENLDEYKALQERIQKKLDLLETTRIALVSTSAFIRIYSNEVEAIGELKDDDKFKEKYAKAITHLTRLKEGERVLNEGFLELYKNI